MGLEQPEEMGGWVGAAAQALISRWLGKGQRERASRRRAEMPGDVHPTGLGVEWKASRV